MKKSITVILISAVLLLACFSVSIADKEAGGMLLADGIPEAGAPSPTAAPAAETDNEAEKTAEEAASENAEIVEASEEAETEPVEIEEEGVLPFGSVRSQIMENNMNVLVLESSIDMLENMDYEGLMDDLRDAINTVADYQWAATTSSIPVQIKGTEGLPDDNPFNIPTTYGIPVADSYTTTQLQAQYDALREQFDNIKDGETQKDNEKMIRGFRNTEELLVQTGETLFVTYKGLEVQYDALNRQNEALSRTLSELTVRKNYGQISDLVLAQAKNGQAQLESGISTLKMNMDNLLLQYKLLLGMDLGADLKLGRVPSVSEDALDAMDLENDLAAAKDASYDLASALDTYTDAEETYKDARDDLMNETGASQKLQWQQAQIAWQTAQNQYRSSCDNFELKFRTLYADVKNKADLLKAAKAALAAEEKNNVAAQVKYKYGQISYNAMLDAADSLASAKDSVSTASYDLFAAYNNYVYAVNSGILN